MLTDATSGNSIPSGVVITAATPNPPATSLVHIGLNDELDSDIRNKLLYGLHMANEHVKSIAMPFAGITLFEHQLWESAQLLIELLKSFFTATSMNNNIVRVCIVCNSLLHADVLRSVCRTLLTSDSAESRLENSAPTQITDNTDIQTPTDSQTDDSVTPRDSSIVNN